ncbi:MAG: histidinol-phosphatase, partial [Calditrichales bacterium]
MKKALFIDRDGTILIEPEDKQIDSLEKMEFVPGVIVNLYRIAKELDYELVMVSNQDGLGTGSFPENTFWPVQNKMLKTLENEGVCFDDILIDRSLPQENLPTRKPGTAMLKKYMNGAYDLKQSYVIGDRDTDMQLAANLGAKAIVLGNHSETKADLVSSDW